MQTRGLILVADDKLVCWAFKKELSVRSFSVRTVGSGAAAVACLRKEAYSLAFIGLPLPDGDGLDLLAQCRAISPETHFVVLSGDDTPASKQSAFALGAAQYIDKPFEISQIIGLVEAQFGDYQERRESRRLLCRLPLRITIVGPGDDDSDRDLYTLAGMTLNLSDHGLQLQTGYRLRVGQHVEVGTHRRQDPCAALLRPNQQARVVWVSIDGDRSTAGLHYL